MTEGSGSNTPVSPPAAGGAVEAADGSVRDGLPDVPERSLGTRAADTVHALLLCGGADPRRLQIALQREREWMDAVREEERAVRESERDRRRHEVRLVELRERKGTRWVLFLLAVILCATVVISLIVTRPSAADGQAEPPVVDKPQTQDAQPQPAATMPAPD